MKKAPDVVNPATMDPVYLYVRQSRGGKENTVKKTNDIWKALVVTGVVGLAFVAMGATALYMNLHQIQHPLNAISNNYAIAMITVGGVFALLGIAALVKRYIVRKKWEELRKKQHQTAVNTVNKELIELKQDLKSIQELRASKDQQIANMQKDFENQNTVLEQVNKNLEDEKQKTNALEVQLKNTTQERTELEKEINLAKIKNGELETYINNMETANTDMQDEISSLKTQLQIVQEEVINLKNEKNQLQEEKQIEIEQHKQSLKNEESKSFETNKQYMAKKYEVQIEQERHNKEIIDLRQLLSEQQKLVQLQNEEIDKLKIEIEEAQKKETHTEDLDTYKNESEIEKQELRDKIKNLETDNAKLKTALEDEVKRKFPISPTRVHRARSVSKTPYPHNTAGIPESNEN